MTEWLVRHSGGGPIGPVSTTLLYRGIELGKVPIDAEVRPAEGGDWLPLASYKEFVGALQEEDIETKVVDSPWFLEQQRSAVGGSAPLSSPRAVPPPLPKTRASGTPSPAATPGRDTYETLDEDDEATRVAAPPDSAHAPMPRPAAGSPSAPPAGSLKAPGPLPKPSMPPLSPPPSSGPRNLPASAPTPSPRGPLPPMSRPPGSLPPVSRAPGSQPPASRAPAAAPAGPPRRHTALGLGPARSITRPTPSPAPSPPPVEEDFDDEAMTKVMQSPRDAPAPPALPAGVPSSPGDRPFDPRRAPTMKIDPLRPAPTAYMSPATAPPQRTAAVGAGHEAPVVVRPDPEPRPAAPPAYARPYAPQFSPPPEPPAFDTTMKALIALIVVLAVALAIVLVLLARR